MGCAASSAMRCLDSSGYRAPFKVIPGLPARRAADLLVAEALLVGPEFWGPVPLPPRRPSGFIGSASPPIAPRAIAVRCIMPEERPLDDDAPGREAAPAVGRP